MAALDTVEKVTNYARILLQDTLEPFRYSTDNMIIALNAAMLDARRLRPDLFLFTPTDVPAYEDVSELIEIDQQYRMALVYFVAGQVQLRDEEDVQDARAAAFLSKFTSMLVEPLMPQSIGR